MTTAKTHVILGTGPLGQSVMQALLKRGQSVRMINRSGKADVARNVEVVGADMNDSVQVYQWTKDAAAVYQCAQPAYNEWTEKFLPFQRSVVDGVARAGAKLIVAENLYMYGDTNGAPLTENTPWNPHTRKGTVRAQMSRELFEAHKAGKVRVAAARGSDFYGPVVEGSAAGDRSFKPLIQGKAAEVYAALDLPHTYTFIGDFGEALAVLGEKDAALGQAWHVPNAETMTQREFFTLAFQLAGQTPKFAVVGRMMMRIGGLFIPAAREVVEMMYEFEKPFIVDDRKYKQAFGDHSTPVKDALQKTVAWYQQDLQHA